MTEEFTNDEYLRVLLTLSEIGVPPSIAADLVRTVPLPEIRSTVIEVIEDDQTLGNLVDRLAYRNIPIREALR